MVIKILDAFEKVSDTCKRSDYKSNKNFYFHAWRAKKKKRKRKLAPIKTTDVFASNNSKQFNKSALLEFFEKLNEWKLRVDHQNFPLDVSCLFF